MNVYVVEADVYSDRNLVGVYSTLEKAMTACGGEFEGEDPYWHNGEDWDKYRNITKVTLDPPNQDKTT